MDKNRLTNDTKRVTIGLSSLMFLISMGEGLVTPVIPLYAADLGAKYSQLGYLMTGYSITYIIATLISGKLSDEIDRKLVILAGVVVNIFAALGYFLAEGFTLLLISKGLEGLGRGILWPATEALITDQAGEKERGKVAGYFMASYGAGVVVGTLLSGFIVVSRGSKTLFAAYPLLTVLAILIFVVLTAGMPKRSADEFRMATPARGHSQWLGVVKNVLPVCFLGFAYAGFLWTVWALLSRMAELYGFSTIGIGIIFAVLWGMRLASFLTSGTLASYLGRARALILGLGCCLLAAVLFSVSANFTVFLMGVTLAGIGTGWIFPNCLTEIASRTDEANRGLGMGLLETIIGIGYGVQPAIAGLTGEILGVQYTFLSNVMILVLAILISLKTINSRTQNIA